MDSQINRATCPSHLVFPVPGGPNTMKGSGAYWPSRIRSTAILCCVSSKLFTQCKGALVPPRLASDEAPVAARPGMTVRRSTRPSDAIVMASCMNTKVLRLIEKRTSKVLPFIQMSRWKEALNLRRTCCGGKGDELRSELP